MCSKMNFHKVPQCKQHWEKEINYYGHIKSTFLYLFLTKTQRLPHWKETQVRTNYVKSYTPGTSLAVQWLRLHAPSAAGMGSTPDWGTKPCMPNGVAKKNWFKNDWLSSCSFPLLKCRWTTWARESLVAGGSFEQDSVLEKIGSQQACSNGKMTVTSCLND